MHRLELLICAAVAALLPHHTLQASRVGIEVIFPSSLYLLLLLPLETVIAFVVWAHFVSTISKIKFCSPLKEFQRFFLHTQWAKKKYNIKKLFHPSPRPPPCRQELLKVFSFPALHNNGAKKLCNNWTQRRKGMWIMLSCAISLFSLNSEFP